MHPTRLGCSCCCTPASPPKQAQLNVTTLRLKAKTREFLSDFTPRVHEAITEYITAQETMLNRMAAEKAGLAQHALGGMRVVRAKRADREVRGRRCLLRAGMLAC